MGTYKPESGNDISGCLEPRRMDRLEHTSQKVEALIRKHASLYEHMSLTLDLTGNDNAAITWNITNAAKLPAWGHVPNSSWEGPPPLAGETLDRANIPLALNATGLRDQQTYEATMRFAIVSYAPLREPQEFAQHQEVWGRLHHRPP